MGLIDARRLPTPYGQETLLQVFFLASLCIGKLVNSHVLGVYLNPGIINLGIFGRMSDKLFSVLEKAIPGAL
ncbi:unnamed protein product [Periconia digitata]|uniref:Uncharacterized protein n=1 Tax=Periconia digitata TaxID=1303443 RepID=A0A9W4UEU2_9PLEO|nr:unnamed protein product [Periconia digitata]